VYGASSYDAGELDGLPTEVVALSVGCANPVALADLRPGEVVLDLGSGGGIDVLLSARRVGPTGKAYGLDMTEEMLELARANQARDGADNVEFLAGHIEAVPLPDRTVDVVISNCVVNLSTDKPAVFAEMHRVLRPGGRLAVADVVADAEVAAALARDLTAWADCLAGAITRVAYRQGLERAGFVEISVTDSHPVADGFASAIVRAAKPPAGGAN
jgi:ubiquinone/menaquinone biosynthesis C-methylase UbiE